MKRFLLPLLGLTLAACFAPVDAPPPPTSIFADTPQSTSPTLTVLPATISLNDIPAVLTAVPENASPNFCEDTRGLKLLLDLQTALQNRDGEFLATLVSPSSGVGVRFIREGKIVTYFDNIKFIFNTTYQADWGLGAGSGQPVKGSFQEIVLPSLDKVFASNPTVTCNGLKVGGATYIPEWPYTGMDYYSLYYPGSSEFNNLDWETWAVGMLRQEGKPQLTALVHYEWEP